MERTYTLYLHPLDSIYAGGLYKQGKETKVRQLRFMLERGATLPTRATDGSAGYDLAAMGRHDLSETMRAMVDTGVHVEVPDGYVGLVFERSSLCRRGFSLMNKVAVIDSDYRGSLTLPLTWSDSYIKTHDSLDEDMCEIGVIDAGERIAQLVVVPCLTAEPVAVAALSETGRGDGGFGSTGA